MDNFQIVSGAISYRHRQNVERERKGERKREQTEQMSCSRFAVACVVAMLHIPATNAEFVQGLMMTATAFLGSDTCTPTKLTNLTTDIDDVTLTANYTVIPYSTNGNESFCYAIYVASEERDGDMLSNEDLYNQTNTWDDVTAAKGWYWVSSENGGWWFEVGTAQFCDNNSTTLTEYPGIFENDSASSPEGIFQTAGLAAAFNNALLGQCMSIFTELQTLYPWATLTWYYKIRTHHMSTYGSEVNRPLNNTSLVVTAYKFITSDATGRRLAGDDTAAFPDPPHLYAPPPSPPPPVLTPVGIVGFVLAGIFGLAFVLSLLNSARLRTARTASAPYATIGAKVPNVGNLGK